MRNTYNQETVPDQAVFVPTNDLRFDVHNPRLAEYGITSSTSDDEILAILWETMDVRELVQSIAASGYFQHEPLIVADEDNRHVVIEGNRRLAAVKVLIRGTVPEGTDQLVPAISDDEKRKLEFIPAIMSDRVRSWRYLGFKHVNGPAKWSSYAKAEYIATVKRSYGISLAQIAEQIGDRHQTVQRLFRGLMVLEQAEKARVYDREDRYRQRLAFSHLYTGLSYDGISSFINLDPLDFEAVEPVPKTKYKQLGELCVWLYGSKKAGVPPVVQSQNPDLRLLNSVLGNRQAIAALRANPQLSVAYETSLGAAEVFEVSLLSAKRELLKARAYVTTGYDATETLLRVCGSVANLADDLYNEMERKHTPRNKKQRLAEDRDV